MKILIIVQRLTGGGAEHVASLWARGFVERGYHVGLVLCCAHNTPISYPVPDSVSIYNIYNKLSFQLSSRLHYDGLQIYKLKRIVKKEKPDVIIGVLQPFTEWARKASVGMNIPIINTEHNAFEVPNSATTRRKRKLKLKFTLNHNYQHITVLTEADKRIIDHLFNNVTVLPNPLAYQPADVLPPKEKIILAAGRLDVWEVKGFDLLIKVWNKIANQFPDWKLCIAGQDGDNARHYLESLVNKDIRTKQVEFLGFCEDLLPIYRKSSIFVLSSRYEGFGLVLIEAMSQGCAPIACNYKGRQGEIITSEEEGILCPVNDGFALADALKKMISDDNYRCKVQKQAVERSTYYSLDKTMDRWDYIFKRYLRIVLS